MGFTDRSIAGEMPGQPLCVGEERPLDHQVKKGSLCSDKPLEDTKALRFSNLLLCTIYRTFVVVYYLYFGK